MKNAPTRAATARGVSLSSSDNDTIKNVSFFTDQRVRNIAEGIDPETPIAIRHAGADFDAMMPTVGVAASLKVSEGNTRSATFVPYKAVSRADIEPSMRFDERPAPDTGQGVERTSGGRASC